MALDPVSALLDVGSKVIDRLWPDPAQRDAAKLELFKLQQSGELAQLAAETELAKGRLLSTRKRRNLHLCSSQAGDHLSAGSAAWRVPGTGLA
jgi:hypothetical protein